MNRNLCSAKNWIENMDLKEQSDRIIAATMSQNAKNSSNAPPRLDPVVEANRALLHQRSQVGIAKYGVTLDGARLGERELIVHAIEEALDLANYLQAQLQRVDRERDDGK